MFWLTNFRKAVAGSLVAAFAFWAPQGAAAQQSLTPQAARGLAFQLVAMGDFPAAVELAELLIARDGADQAAWLALAQAQSGRGDHAAALRAARRAWATAQTDGERYSSAIVAARVLQLGGSTERAKFWYRRAAQNAPHEGFRGAAVQEFRALRREAPFSTQLSFGLSPSSNINNGARSAEVYGGTLGAESLALSGLEVQAGAEFRYRLTRSARRETSLALDIDTASYVLSSAARAAAPGADAADYAFQQVKLRYDTHLLSANGKAMTTLSAHIGANAAGGAHLSNIYGAEAEHQRALGPAGRLGFGASLAHADRMDSAARDNTQSTVFASYEHRLAEDGRRVSLSAQLSDLATDATSMARESYAVSLGYHIAQAPLDTALDLSLSFGEADYDHDFSIFGPRRDQTVSLAATATLKGREYYGFVPTIGLALKRTQSTVDLFDTETFEVNFGLRSAF